LYRALTLLAIWQSIQKASAECKSCGFSEKKGEKCYVSSSLAGKCKIKGDLKIFTLMRGKKKKRKKGRK